MSLSNLTIPVAHKFVLVAKKLGKHPFCVLCLIAPSVLISLWALPTKLVPPEYSKVVYAIEGQVLRAYLSSDEKWRFETKKTGFVKTQNTFLRLIYA